MGREDESGQVGRHGQGPRRTLFLCWSGNRSKQLATQFKAYFDSVFAEAFKGEESSQPRVAMSETAIKKGTPWIEQLLADLDNAAAGLVCLTPENRGSMWLHFEGGSLAGQGNRARDTEDEDSAPSSTLFCFLFTMDNVAQQGPLSLFQATVYTREYERDREELRRLTRSVLERFEGCEGIEDFDEPLRVLVDGLRQLEFLAFRDLVPDLERHARSVLQTIDELDSARSRLDALSALFALATRLEDAQRTAEVMCAPSQLMFFERLREAVAAAKDAVEDLIADGFRPPREPFQLLDRMLAAAIEPLPPVVDDSWRYALYGHQQPQQAYRKRKLLLVHPLENALQRAELRDKEKQPGSGAARDKNASAKSEDQAQDAIVLPGKLLNANEKKRALRSFWAFDRIASYIHYCEDTSFPMSEKDLDDAVVELTRAVLKEMSLLEVGETQHDSLIREHDDLPLRFAVRALVLKVKRGVGHGGMPCESAKNAVSNRSAVRTVIENRTKLETGMSFEGVDEMLTALRGIAVRTDQRNEFGLKPPLASLCDDLERVLRPTPSGPREGAGDP